jgi:hypothetical protein
LTDGGNTVQINAEDKPKGKEQANKLSDYKRLKTALYY